jgi:hypothetical protein
MQSTGSTSNDSAINPAEGHSNNSSSSCMLSLPGRPSNMTHFHRYLTQNLLGWHVHTCRRSVLWQLMAHSAPSNLLSVVSQHPHDPATSHRKVPPPPLTLKPHLLLSELLLLLLLLLWLLPCCCWVAQCSGCTRLGLLTAWTTSSGESCDAVWRPRVGCTQAATQATGMLACIWTKHVCCHHVARKLLA